MRDTVKAAVDATAFGPPARRAVRAARRGVARLRPVPAWRVRNSLDDEHLRLLLAFSLTAEANCIDIGANAGHLLAHMVRYAPEGQHLAFEPLPFLQEQLRACFPGVTVRPEALSDRCGTAQFVVDERLPTRSGLADFGHAGVAITVPVATLDSVVLPDDPVAVIKIDVEGAELATLRGAAQTLARHRPVVCFEHGHNLAEGRPPDDQRTGAVFDELAQHGLRIFDMDGTGPLDRTAFLAVCRTGARWNFYARP